MTFCKFESNFCKVTLKVTLNSARQITIFITILSPPLSPPLSPTNFETISTPSLHFWRRNATNKQVFGVNLAILKVRWHLRKRWFEVLADRGTQFKPWMSSSIPRAVTSAPKKYEVIEIHSVVVYNMGERERERTA